MQPEHARHERWLARHLPSRAHTPGGVATLEEPVGHGLNNLFILRLQNLEYLGRKLLDEQGQLGSRLTPAMLLGPLLRTRQCGNRLQMHYRTLSTDEKHQVFAQARRSNDTSIHFPFPVVDEQGQELVAPASFWNDTPQLARRLDAQERHFREHCLATLQKRLAPGAVIHDPACSTGTFIATLAQGLPGAQCLGSDVSPAMIAHARTHQRLPNLKFDIADATDSAAADSCDVLILRFLNAEVMLRQQATRLFQTLSRRVRRAGVIIVFGHTPVLVAIEPEAKRLGLKVTGTIAACPDTQALFQFFILERD